MVAPPADPTAPHDKLAGAAVARSSRIAPVGAAPNLLPVQSAPVYGARDPVPLRMREAADMQLRRDARERAAKRHPAARWAPRPHQPGTGAHQRARAPARSGSGSGTGSGSGSGSGSGRHMFVCRTKVRNNRSRAGNCQNHNGVNDHSSLPYREFLQDEGRKLLGTCFG